MAVKNSTGRRNMTIQKRKTFVFCVLSVTALLLLGVRVGYLMIMRSEHYTERALDLHERERDIKAASTCRQQDCLYHFCYLQSDKGTRKSDRNVVP